MPRVLLIDGNPFLYRAAYSGPIDKISQKVLTYLVDVLRKFTPDDVVVCWDKGKSRWRTELYPEYKQNRLSKKKDIDMVGFEEQAVLVKRYIDALGLRQICVPQVEADDMLAWLSEYYLTALTGDWTAILITRDRDLWQLVTDRLLVYDHQKEQFIDYNGVQAHFGVPPEWVPDLKVLEGDSSDNIPGIKGIGPETAPPVLSEYGGIGQLLNPVNAKSLGKKKKTARILADGELMGEFYRLVALPKLYEAVYCLSPSELKELSSQVSKPLERDPFKVQMLGEYSGVPFMDFKNSLPAASLVDLDNFVNLIKFWGEGSTANISTVEDLDTRLSHCNLCALRGGCNPKGPTYPTGTPDRKIMLIGAGPTREDWDAGVVFKEDSPSGVVIDTFLKSANISWDECWRTTVCKCHSPSGTPLTYPQLNACMNYLRNEIRIIQPKLILVFGTEAMAAVTPYTSKLFEHVGEVLENPYGLVGQVSATVIICPNPVAALRSERSASDLEYCSNVVKKLLEEVGYE